MSGGGDLGRYEVLVLSGRFAGKVFRVSEHVDGVREGFRFLLFWRFRGYESGNDNVMARRKTCSIMIFK